MYTSHNLWLHSWLHGFASCGVFSSHIDSEWIQSAIPDWYDSLCVILGGEPI